MTFTLSAGWLLLPFGVTVASLLWYNCLSKPFRGGRGAADGFIEALLLFSLLAASLLAWLLWAVFR